MKPQQKYLTLFLSLGILLSVFVYFRMLQFLREETPPLEFRYSSEHREPSPAKMQTPKTPGRLQKSAAKEEARTPDATPEPFDINTADKTQLMEIPGIGPKMADTLMDYREKNGPFKKVEDLLNVPGIGPKKLEKMKPYLENLQAGSSSKPVPAHPAKPLLCPHCGAELPADNSKNARHEKPYCLKCLHYLADEGSANPDTVHPKAS